MIENGSLLIALESMVVMVAMVVLFTAIYRKKFEISVPDIVTITVAIVGSVLVTVLSNNEIWSMSKYILWIFAGISILFLVAMVIWLSIIVDPLLKAYIMKKYGLTEILTFYLIVVAMGFILSEIALLFLLIPVFFFILVLLQSTWINNVSSTTVLEKVVVKDLDRFKRKMVKLNTFKSPDTIFRKEETLTNLQVDLNLAFGLLVRRVADEENTLYIKAGCKKVVEIIESRCQKDKKIVPFVKPLLENELNKVAKAIDTSKKQFVEELIEIIKK